jgi:hypothetical protein
MVIQDLYEQLYGKKELVIEYLINGKLSDRVLEAV